jgi:hypothetical protein
MKKILFFGFLIVNSLLNAQGLIGTPNSLILVYNYPDNYFYIEIQGKNKQKTEYENVFVIDDKSVQVLTLKTSKFLDNDDNLSKKKIIEKYIDWEAIYLKEMYQFDISSKVEFLKSPKGRDFAFWTYEMPIGDTIKTDSTITVPTQKQMFVISLIKDYILGINSPLFENNQFDNIKNYLITNIDGIVESKIEIDIEELNKQVNK